MEIKIDLTETKESIEIEEMGMYKARNKESGKIVLIIPGFRECHYIDSKGNIGWTSNHEHMKNNYIILEEVKLKW